MSTSPTTTPTRKESLFEIGEHFNALEELVIENDGEITDQIDQWLAEYEGKETDKIDAYCYLISRFEDISDEAKRLADRATTYRRKARRLKRRLKVYLQKQNRDSYETPRFSLTVAGNGGRAPVQLHEGIDPDMLPIEYQKIRIDADKTKIRRALKGGDQDIRMFASLGERGTHLRIR